MRVRELAQELGVDSKEILEACKGLGIQVRNEMSTLTPGQATGIKGCVQEAAEARAKAAKLAERAAAKRAVEEKKAAAAAAKAALFAQEAAAQEAKLAEKDMKEVKAARPKKGGGPKPDALPVTSAVPPVPVPVPLPAPPPPPPRPVAPPKVLVPRPNLPGSKPPAVAKPATPVAPAAAPVPVRSPFGLVKDAPPKPPEDLTRPVSMPGAGRPTPRAGGGPPSSSLMSKRGDRRDGRGSFADDMTAPSKMERPERTEAVKVPIPISVKDFSQVSGVKTSFILKKLMDLGTLATINHTLTGDLVELLAQEFRLRIEMVKKEDLEQELVETASTPDRPEDLKPRPPVVTFMGHVDHGKTSLLDRIRKTKVAEGEAGGITQHIGAYRVPVGSSHVVFLDTPGHEAFTAMRARGASITDVVVLVVAADDGVMPQTEEAYNHAKAAGVPVIVAMNKCDKGDANPMKVLQQLSGIGIQSKEWGGEAEVVQVSALTGLGMDSLLEHIAYVTELKELKANPKKPGRGTVLEAKLSEGRGVIAHVLIQEGTLRRGDTLLCGRTICTVRAMHDDRGRILQEAGPAVPVEITGFNVLPEAGDIFVAMKDKHKAKEIAEARAHKMREAELVSKRHVTLENFFQTTQATTGAAADLRVVLKADVKGSLEVLAKAIADLPTGQVKVRILHSGVGAITEGDILLADASDAVLLSFHIVPEKKVRELAEFKGVEIRTYQVIYNLTDDLKKSMEGMLKPEAREVVDGEARILQLFKISKVGTIAGCKVEKGSIKRNSRIRIVRDGAQIHEGELDSLKRIKDDAREVKEGFECGIKVHNFDDLKVDDILQAYRIEEVARKLEAAPGA